MQRLSASQKDFLWEAAQRYRLSLPGSPAERYLESRDLASPEVGKFGLGYVADPLPGHEIYRGKLVIPYLRRNAVGEWAVVSLRFRCTEDHDHHGHGKYMTQAGDKPRLYNTLALQETSPRIAITEGEFDAITAQLAGVPAVGVPGAQNWRDHFVEPFKGYREVFVLADGDEPGLEFANHVARSLYNARVIPMPPGEDVNSLVVNRGGQALLSRLT